MWRSVLLAGTLAFLANAGAQDAGHRAAWPAAMRLNEIIGIVEVLTPEGRSLGPITDLYFDPALMARAREQLIAENGGMRTYAVFFERLEVGFGDDAESYAWQAQGWYGGDIHRFWWKSEGEGAFEDDLEHAELQLLFSRAVTPYFDLQAGLRQSYFDGEDQTDLVLGVQGARGLVGDRAADLRHPRLELTVAADREVQLHALSTCQTSGASDGK